MGKSEIKIIMLLASILILIVLIGCTNGINMNNESEGVASESDGYSDSSNELLESNSFEVKTFYKVDDEFTSRDLKNDVDLNGAVRHTVQDYENISIKDEGIYIISGKSSNTTININAQDDDKVQIVLDGLEITNNGIPCIYVQNADKVFITTTNSENKLIVTDMASKDDSSIDGAIYSKSDLALNGLGTLTIESTAKGIVSKDDLKITGGKYTISAKNVAIRANDSIRVTNCEINVLSGTDGLHAENNSDSSKGYVYIASGTINLNINDDAIHASSIVQIDDGNLSLNGAEGIEATYIQVNGGNININAVDDGLNAGQKINDYTPTIEINGGTIQIVMASGDTDGIDSNGDIIINGGTINVTGSSTFDYDGQAEFNGGTIIVNGQEIDYIPNQMMGNVGRGRGRR